MAPADPMQKVLTRINKVPGIRGSLLMGEDGFVIAANLADGEDTERLAALGSTLASTLQSALDRMSRGGLTRSVINGGNGSAVLMPVGTSMLLTLTRKDANMGMVLVELRESAGELNNLL